MVAAVAYPVLALIVVSPLPARLFSHLPLGSLDAPTVPYFNLWTLAWNADRFALGFAGYWDAPLFYPARDTFAFSEPQGLTGLWFTPLAQLFGRVAAYNLTLLSLLVLNGWSGRRLLRAAGVSRWSATLGGAAVLALPFVIHELGVLQLCAAWPCLLGLAEIAVLSRKPAPWALVRLAIWTVATGWSCIYYLLFFGVFVVLAAFMLLRRSLLRPAMLGAGVAAVGIVALGLLPLMAAEQRAVSGFTRGARTIHAGSASTAAYLRLPAHTPLARLFPRLARSEGSRSLYPGLVYCGLAAYGVGWTRRRPEQRRFWRFCLVCGVLALWLSIGTRLQVGYVQPYEVVAQRHLPGFGQLRSPYRAALFVQVFLVVFAGLGLDRLAAWGRGRSPRIARHLPVLAAALALFEVVPQHTSIQRFPHEVMAEPWIRWLALQPEGAVAMVPPNASGRAHDYPDTVLGMLQSLEHKHPIVNGYSGFFPPESDRLVALMRQFPKPASVRALRKHGVRYAVVDRRWPQASTLSARPAPGVTRIFDIGRRMVYRLSSDR
ncbi:MAG: hypothetical protein ABW321_16225 [Polyangiales bacterium]